MSAGERSDEAKVTPDEELLASLQKLRRLAHDANNALMVVTSYSELLREKLPRGHPQDEYVDEILRAGERCQKLVREMLDLEKKLTGDAPPPGDVIG